MSIVCKLLQFGHLKQQTTACTSTGASHTSASMGSTFRAECWQHSSRPPKTQHLNLAVGRRQLGITPLWISRCAGFLFRWPVILPWPRGAKPQPTHSISCYSSWEQLCNYFKTSRIQFTGNVSSSLWSLKLWCTFQVRTEVRIPGWYRAQGHFRVHSQLPSPVVLSVTGMTHQTPWQTKPQSMPSQSKTLEHETSFSFSFHKQ